MILGRSARSLALVLLAITTQSRADGPRPSDPDQRLERTCFQTHARWDGRLQLRSDVAVCYGIDDGLPARVAQWKAQGYVVHLMTGVSWGNYLDYIDGRFDGVKHDDEIQTDRDGKGIAHGRDVYYMSPGENYGKYLCQGVKRAMDAGAEAVHLEEPEFWVRGGYSESFRREWKAYYGEDWVAPHSSPEAQFRASQLKYFLYGRALKQVFDFVKAENARTGRKVKCYVPTHSLINYAHWKIVSPESSLLKVGADGFVAQVWTGTARTPNVYQRVTKERTFETAFLEYGSMTDVVRANGGTVWFLNDPIEDNPDHSWDDYRSNWESTLTASLLWPQVWRYEVMPWPERIFRGRYPTVDRARREPGRPVERVAIPPSYATELLTVINALNDMDQPEVAWDCGTRGVGVLVSDTLMFQRGGPSPSDEHLGSFYGLAMPLLKRGIPARPVQLENATAPGALDPHKVLLLTYEGMKPMSADVHDALAGWVRNGGALVVLGDDADPFNAVRSWWNDPKASKPYPAPRLHLFERLGLPADASPGTHKVGRGVVVYDRASPAALTYRPDGGDTLRAAVRSACEAVGLAYAEANHLTLRRGPYVVAAGLDETGDGPEPVLHGRFLDLFDTALPTVTTATLKPGSRRLLLDLDKTPADAPRVVASACKTLGAQVDASGGLAFHAEGPDGTDAVVAIRLPTPPGAATVDGQPLADDARSWEPSTNLLRLRFPNKSAGRRVEVRPG